MTDKNAPDGSTPSPTSDAPANPARRRLLGGLALSGAALAVGGGAAAASARGAAAGTHGTGTGTHAPVAPRDEDAVDAALARHIQHVVVIYLENRSFNNLCGDFPGVEQPLSALKPQDFLQRDRDGSVLKTLPPIWGGLVPHAQNVDHRRYHIRQDDIANLTNAPFALRTPEGEPLPHGVITHDLWHKFYQNQMQINGGRNDGFVAWGNTGAQVMGYYEDGAYNLQLWQLAREFTLCDNFFMGTFGGSFLNHQYLAAAQPPYYPHADKSPASVQIAQIEGDDPAGIRLKLADDSPASAMQGRPTFASLDALTPDFHAVNTMGPPYAPAFSQDPHDPLLADPDSPNTLPPQDHATIGDLLSARGIDWAWYAGAWQAALDGHGDGAPNEFPERPNFQAHHQPFNYFRAYAPGTEARARHLRDAGVGEIPRTNHFLADIRAGRLPAVSYYKPQGNLNMHAGYSDVAAGDRHVALIVDALRRGPQWQDMLIVITTDENGGWWDHVPPPKGDRWGPGTRIPALVVSPHAKKGHVDHTIYDTGSIARFLTRRFGLEKLPGLKLREDAMRAAGGVAPGDLTQALVFD